MTAKILASVITLVLNAVLAVAVLLFLLLAMNGYSESDAETGLIVYVVLAVLSAILAADASAWVVSMMIRRRFVPASSAVIAVPLCTAFGAGLIVPSALIAVLIAEYVRVNY